MALRSPLASPLRATSFRASMRGRGRSMEPAVGPAISDLTSAPFVVAHRGGAAIRAELAAPSYATVLAAGFTVFDSDVRLTSDGGLALMHDATLDRTTTTTGNIVDITTDTYRALTQDPATYLSAAGYSNVTPQVTLDDLFAVYGNRVVHMVEAKVEGAVAPIIAAAQTAGIDADHLMICAFTDTWLADVVTAGYPACYLVGALTEAVPATVAAAGIGYVGANSALTAGNVAACHAEGLKVGAWTYSRRSEWATFQAAGVDFVWSDQPEWTAGPTAVTTSDPYATKRWWHGSLSDTSRGGFSNTADWGYTETNTVFRGAVQGWGCPIAAAAGSYSITYQCAIDAVEGADLTRWAAIWFGAATDIVYLDASAAGENGYLVLTRANGAMTLFRRVNGTAVQLATATIAAPTLGTKYTYTLTVSPTAITFKRSDVATTISSNDTTHRGGYFHLGRQGASARFSNVVIT